ncbi:MAG: hypothetical protein N5P05_004171 (plasmid) [Chroococcopsis gigantea SAG 12.99]|nr:hypothetical protein [Chroococcopsis gigantea SAG 12.99]
MIHQLSATNLIENLQSSDLTINNSYTSNENNTIIAVNSKEEIAVSEALPILKPASYLTNQPVALTVQSVTTPAVITLNVNTVSDQNDGSATGGLSLRDAIISANQNTANQYIINLQGGFRYNLSIVGSDSNSGDLNILQNANIKIVGQDNQPAIIDAQVLDDRVLSVSSSAVLRLENVTITGGSQRSEGSGIYNSGELTLVNSKVTNNNSQSGGGIYNTGKLNLINTSSTDNTSSRGGGIYQQSGTLNIINSTITNNLKAFYGGGLYIQGGTNTLINTTISGNKVLAGGGGIFQEARRGGVTTLSNVTITDNTADSDNQNNDSTFFDRGGGFYNNGGNVILNNTIIAGNIDASNPASTDNQSPDVVGFFISNGRNLIGNTTGATGFNSQDILNVAPGLGPLQNNGGLTPTHALLPNSPAVNAGINNQVAEDAFDLNGDGNTLQLTPVDQRGFNRFFGGVVDIGAYEFSFDPYEYCASNQDLITSPIANNPQELINHFFSFGRFEGRSIDSFDQWRYLASNPDLINFYGTNISAGTQHYIQYGSNEQRSVNAFNPTQYIASWDDLTNYYGYNPEGGSQHYVASGYKPENRRVDIFKPDIYIASYGDLIEAIRYNLEDGTRHYILNGNKESFRNKGVHGRGSFNPQIYLNNYPDLQAAFGNNLTKATEHYITNGYYEILSGTRGQPTTSFV